jgi:hypothetical protein
MSTAGVVYKDLLPVPHVTEPEHEATSKTMTERPTDSHELAMAAAKAPEEMGAAQVGHGNEVKNLGWNEPQEAVENPLVGGLTNDDLWVLVRRFNKVSATHTYLKFRALMNIANVPCQGKA